MHESASRCAYPRPQLERREWTCLDGGWDFALDPEARWSVPEQVEWNATINVPFAPETAASGIGNTGFFRACWYRRKLKMPDKLGRRLILHFGAVDHVATIWVNGNIAGRHEGGYTPFSVDITDLVFGPGDQTIVVHAEDDPADLTKPRGKQDWQLNPHSIWYPRTSGIWQTVWLEPVPPTRIGCIRMMPSLENWAIGFEARLEGERREGVHLHVRMHVDDHVVSDDSYVMIAGEVHRRIQPSDPGIDDYRNELLWSPESPTLIDVELQLHDPDGTLLDEVHSYTAIRSIGVQGDRFVLNGRPYHLRMVLDQGYWPESGLTPPDDEALQRDIGLVKAMGFNGVRKHQKIEDPRFLYWADRMGLLVWEEMPSAYRYTTRSIQALTREWLQVMERDSSHPCIVAWVPFNESWGVPDLPDSPAQRHYVQALYHLTKTIDPTRPVIGNDGWESIATDIIGVHDYDDQVERLARRYATDEVLPRLLERERPGGRILVLDGQERGSQPLMLTEFGGVAYSRSSEGNWGYSRSDSPEQFADRVLDLLGVIRGLSALAGFCYTQFTDTYQEVNGLLYFDRTAKIPLEDIAMAVRGAVNEHDRQLDWLWRERIMNRQRERYVIPNEDHKVKES